MENRIKVTGAIKVVRAMIQNSRHIPEKAAILVVTPKNVTHILRDDITVMEAVCQVKDILMAEGSWNTPEIVNRKMPVVQHRLPF